jgi:hypothetical protein
VLIYTKRFLEDQQSASCRLVRRAGYPRPHRGTVIDDEIDPFRLKVHQMAAELDLIGLE